MLVRAGDTVLGTHTRTAATLTELARLKLTT